MNQELKNKLKDIALGSGHITVLTGAGISAESGIPTFRGADGYWTVGSREYHPQQMATYQMFTRHPEEVWKWYLYRLEVCRKAEPNPGHLALAEMENIFEDRFTLITQNVDGLHLRAGSSPERTFQIHGNIFYMRCAEQCSANLYLIPEALYGRSKGQEIKEAERKLLTCPECGSSARPHVLWFDETYNEMLFRYDSSLEVSQKTKLLIIVGTSGATNLPTQIAREVFWRGGTIIDINIEKNPFSQMAERNGWFIQAAGGVVLPEILQIFNNSGERK